MKPHQEETEIVNMGVSEEKKEVKVSMSMTTPIRDELVALVRDYQDIFAWSYQDMLSLNPSIVQHRLPLNPGCSPVKQKLKRMKPEMSLKIKEEFKKQFDVGFLAVARYPDGSLTLCQSLRKMGRYECVWTIWI